MVTNTYTKMFQALSPKNITDFAKKGEGTVKDGIQVYVLAWFVTLVLGIIGFFVAVGTTPEVEQLAQMFGMSTVGILGVVLLVVTSVIGLIVGLVVQYITQYAGAFSAKSLFKGKGKFEKQFYLVMLFTGALMIIASVLGLIEVIVPSIVMIVGIIELLLALWSLYLLYHTLRVVHDISLAGGIVCVIIILLVTFVIAFALALVLGGALLAGALGGAAAASQMGNVPI